MICQIENTQKLNNTAKAKAKHEIPTKTGTKIDTHIKARVNCAYTVILNRQRGGGGQKKVANTGSPPKNRHNQLPLILTALLRVA